MLRVPTSRTGRAVLVSTGTVAAAGAVAVLTVLGGGQLGALLLSLLVVGAAFLTRRPALESKGQAAGSGRDTGTDGRQS
jgi:hypothetical protein